MRRGILSIGSLGFVLGAACGAGAMLLAPAGKMAVPSGGTLLPAAGLGIPAASATPAALPEILPDPDAPPGSPEELLAAAEQYDADREREVRERLANDLEVWGPFFTSLLSLNPAQVEALNRQATPALMEKLLKSSNFLSAEQREKLAIYKKDRAVNYSEVTAQRQMAWVQEHLPLSPSDKDRLWQLLTVHALALTEAGADLGKQDEAKQRMKAQVTAVLPPAAAAVALSYLEAGLEDLPPGMEDMPTDGGGDAHGDPGPGDPP